jgi:hypothetical protein
VVVVVVVCLFVEMMSTAGALSTCFVDPGVGMLRMTKVLDGSRRAANESSSSSNSNSSSATSSRRPQQQLEESFHMSETCTKAAAWAVFQHHGGGGGGAAAAPAAATNYSYRQCYGIAVRRATRFKIEAQMKNGGGGGGHHHHHHHAAMPASSTTVCNSGGVFMKQLHQWDAGSTLFDSYELDAVSKQFDRAFQLLPSSSSSSSYSPEQQQQHHHHPPGAAARLHAYIDESHLALDTTRITSPFSPQLWHQDERVLLPAASESSWNNMQLDCVEEEFYTRRETLQQQQHRFFFQPCGATAAIIQPPAAAAADYTTSDGENNTAEEESTTFEEPVKLETCFKLGQNLHGPFQFAIQTPNPLNLSQRNARSSRDKFSHDTDHGARRQSFQEKVRSFFHKARISPQSESSSPAASSSHHSISGSSRDQSLNRPPRGGRKLSYTATTAPGPQEDSLLSNHDGWSYVDDQTHAWSDELLLKPPPVVVVVAAKHRKSGSFSLRSVTKALQNSLPHLGISESQRQRSQSTSDIHQQLQRQQELQQQHHHVYNHHHHHHHVVIEQQQKQQQQQEEDYELTLQDIDRRVPRKSIEEKTRRISFEDAAGNNNFNKVHRNSLEEEKRKQHSMTNSSASEQNKVHHHNIFA